VPEGVEKCGVTRNKRRDVLALMGDSIDNIPGVPGVGPKTASDLINQHGTLEAIYENMDQIKRPKLKEALTESGIQVSLVGEVDRHVAGFLLAKVYYGEFGVAEPTAVLDTIGVASDDRGHGVAAALLEQLRTNLRGLGIPRLGTEVHWDDQSLLSFFHHEGFRPAARLCLECDLDDRRLRERADARAAT
jgi:GNAT superfamily N-acetyltransferase